MLKAGRLHRNVNGQTKLVIPQQVRWRIAKTCHDEAGSFGPEKTIEMINKSFYFLEFDDAVSPGVLPIPFRCIHMNHLGHFPKSKKGNLYIPVLVLVCAFSKFTIVWPLRSTKTVPVVVTLQEVMAYFGQPIKIITNQGRAFTSKDFSSFVKAYGIQHVRNAGR